MSFDISRIRRLLSHRILVSVVPYAPSDLCWPGFRDPPSEDYGSLEVPTYVRRRLIAFLEARYPVLPRHLDSILPQSEAGSARIAYRKLRSEDYSPDDALRALGLYVTRSVWNSPEALVARILKRGCDCLDPALDAVFIPVACGEPIDSSHRIILCDRVFARVDRGTARDSERAANRERLGCAALREGCASAISASA